MASSRQVLDFILDQLSGLEGITYRAMMGEYLLYYRGKLFGGVYDDRLLIKPTKAAAAMLPGAEYEAPYEGAKPMLAVDRPEDGAFLRALITATADQLPVPGKRGK